eukprot:6612202-Pyramimonas_sp.AAC.1
MSNVPRRVGAECLSDPTSLFLDVCAVDTDTARGLTKQVGLDQSDAGRAGIFSRFTNRTQQGTLPSRRVREYPSALETSCVAAVGKHVPNKRVGSATH